MKLSLSVRIAEAASKDRMTMPLDAFAVLARDVGYDAVCLRASAVGVQSPRQAILDCRRLLDDLKMPVSMVTTDVHVPLNDDHGPDNLRDFGPHLDVAEMLGANLVRVCMKRDEDIDAARVASDQARERAIRVAHQCHHGSLFETVPQILDTVERVGRSNFGVIYEPANLMLCGEAYGRETLERLAPHIMNVYVQNHRIADEGDVVVDTRARGQVRYVDLPLWESGGVDFHEVFAGLKAIHYDGFVTVHQEFARLMPAEQAARRSHAVLMEWIH